MMIAGEPEEALADEIHQLRDLAKRLWRWIDSCTAVSLEDVQALAADESLAQLVLDKPADRPSDVEP